MAGWFAVPSACPANRDIARDETTTVPVEWLLVEWPKGRPHRLLALHPAGGHPAGLVRLARIRWRIEHD